MDGGDEAERNEFQRDFWRGTYRQDFTHRPPTYQFWLARILGRKLPGGAYSWRGKFWIMKRPDER